MVRKGEVGREVDVPGQLGGVHDAHRQAEALGLGAVADAVATVAAEGVARVVVAHADLPLATSLAWVADGDGVTLVPDRHDDGTNVLAVPSDAGFRFAYGPGSFARHVTEADRLGLATRIVREPTLGWDVDLPADLELPCG